MDRLYRWSWLMPTYDSAGVRIHYVEQGTGLPVVLVHGLTSSAERNWRRPGIIDALVTAGHRVVALDCRGHGESDKPHDPSAYGGTKMGDDVIALMDHLDIDVADLAGYSMGGAIAASLLARRPERFRRVIIAGVGDWVLNMDSGTRRPNRRRVGPVGAALRSWLMQRVAQRSGNDPEALAAFRAAVRSSIDKEKLAAARCPVLILVGRDDRGARPADKLAAAIPGAQIKTVPGNHLSAVINPEFRRAIVAFLTP
jgi:pimeloyl-ACP methyl ester carboxylesterase